MLIPFAMPPEIYQPVRDARLAWERTQPQLFFDLEVGDRAEQQPRQVLGRQVRTGGDAHLDDLPGAPQSPEADPTSPNLQSGEPQRRTAPGRTTT